MLSAPQIVSGVYTFLVSNLLMVAVHYSPESEWLLCLIVFQAC